MDRGNLTASDHEKNKLTLITPHCQEENMSIVRGYIIDEGGVPYNYRSSQTLEFGQAALRLSGDPLCRRSERYDDPNGTVNAANRRAVVLFGERAVDFEGVNFEEALSIVEERKPKLVDISEVGRFVPAFGRVNLAKPVGSRY
jgi:PAS domain-containing protein